MQAGQLDDFSGYQVPPKPIPVRQSDQPEEPENADQPGYAYPPLPTLPILERTASISDTAEPITTQPGGGSSGNCPPGLEILRDLDSVFIKQDLELLEAMFGCETKNKYKVKNKQGKIIFIAKEEGGSCTRNCCRSLRPFELTILDSEEREVIHLSRPFACNCCLCPCFLQSIDVEAPRGTLIGSVVQDWSIMIPRFRILNANGDTRYQMQGPACTFSICGNVEFKVLSKDGSSDVGKISKKWSGLAQEAFTDADNFGLTFSGDMDAKMKAVMLGALFLIDLMYYEH